jgi:6-phosphogluconolactonase
VSKRIHQFATSDDLVDALSSRLAALATQCLDRHGYFSIVLAGGTTPRQLYERLRYIVTDWQRWHIYFGDERCLPDGHPERNDSMAATAWLDHVAIPPTQIYRVPVCDTVHMAAAAYAAILQQAPGFDLALLGLGEDGHTASLFPGDPEACNSSELAIAVTDAPKPPPERVSMSAKCLGMAAAVWFLVTGSAKQPALEAWLTGASLPPQTINPHSGIDIFTDIILPSALLRTT